MLKIIAIALLAAGCAALVAGIIIFVVTGGLNLIREIRQAKNVTFDYSTQNTASDIYYNKADNSFEKPKEKIRFTEVKTEAEEKERASDLEIQQDLEEFEIEDALEEGNQGSDLIMQTAPLKGMQRDTAPLSDAEDSVPVLAGRAEMESDTAPLNEQNTQPLSFDLEELFEEVEKERQTAPLARQDGRSAEQRQGGAHREESPDAAEAIVDEKDPWQTEPLTEGNTGNRETGERDTAPLTHEFTEPLIDEISEIRPDKAKEFTVDFEKLFRH